MYKCHKKEDCSVIFLFLTTPNYLEIPNGEKPMSPKLLGCNSEASAPIWCWKWQASRQAQDYDFPQSHPHVSSIDSAGCQSQWPCDYHQACQQLTQCSRLRCQRSGSHNNDSSPIEISEYQGSPSATQIINSKGHCCIFFPPQQLSMNPLHSQYANARASVWSMHSIKVSWNISWRKQPTESFWLLTHFKQPVAFCQFLTNMTNFLVRLTPQAHYTAIPLSYRTNDPIWNTLLGRKNNYIYFCETLC